jgi:hypothetical protein
MLTGSGEPVMDSNTGKPVMQNFSLFLNCLPAVEEGEKEIKLGVTIPESKNYVFSMDNIQRKSITAAILVDEVLGNQVDLLSGNYVIPSIEKGEYTSRFKLLVKMSESTTPIEIVKSEDVFAYANNNVLYVKNLNIGDQVKVLDLSGRSVASGVASGNEYSVGLAQKGVYLVNVKGKNTLVLKVLNK